MTMPRRKSSVLLLPPEIKNIVYELLIPAEVSIYLDVTTAYTISPAKLVITNIPHGFDKYVDDCPEAVDALKTCTKVMSVCKELRESLARLIFPAVNFVFSSWRAAERFSQILTPDTKGMIRNLRFDQKPDRAMTDVQLRTAWLDVLSGFNNIRRICIAYIHKNGHVLEKGTTFDERDLRYLKAIVAKHVNLNKFYHTNDDPIYGLRLYPTAYLQAFDIMAAADVTEFDPADEYKKFLAKQREKKAVRKEEKEAAAQAAELAASTEHAV